MPSDRGAARRGWFIGRVSIQSTISFPSLKSHFPLVDKAVEIPDRRNHKSALAVGDLHMMG